MDIDILITILLDDKASSILRKNEESLFSFIPELRLSKGFDQHNIWHSYDVLEHIYHVVDNVDSTIPLRLAALFHDVGKPYTFTIDENDCGHFYNHWEVSRDIFLKFVDNKNINSRIKNLVSNLILYHDMNLSKINKDRLSMICNTFNDQEIEMLFELKKADLLAQNKSFHYLLDDYRKQEEYILGGHYFYEEKCRNTSIQKRKR